MNYLGGDDQPIKAYTDEVFNEKIFTFSIKEEDYFLNFFMQWDRVTTEIYVFDMGKHTFHIPSGFYVFTGCPSGNVDWILVDELIGRKSIDVFLMPPTFKSWQLESPVLTNSFTGEFNQPVTNDVIPLVSEDGKRTLLVSAKDIYHKWKDKDYSAPFVV